MARRGVPKQVNWYLREWMDTVFPVARGRQTKMAEATGWSKATTSQLYNGTQDYSPKLVNEAAHALHCEPFELLIPPERAMAIRGYRDSAVQLVNHEPAPEEPTSLGLERSRRATGSHEDRKSNTGG